MNKSRQKIADVLSLLYGSGVFIALFAGGLSFLGYLAAFIIGGETATAICVFIYKKAYPVLFYFSSSVVLLGLIKMYVAGEKSMVPGKRRAREQKSESKN